MFKYIFFECKLVEWLFYFSVMKKYFLIVFLFSSYLVVAQNKTEAYIQKYSQIATDEMNMYNIPASITLAQGILESGNGESRLAVDGKNHFGIKCHSRWKGKTIIEDDDEKGECFRKYNRVSDSYRDHSLFLNERGRYSFLFKYQMADYKKWAKGLKKAGYASNPKYPTLLINLIEKYDLSRFDKGTKSKQNLYFAHSYGFPYLSGIGAYYFNKKSLCFTEVNTSFAFSCLNLGYNYKLFNDFYTGANTGIIYLPTKENSIIPQISTELMYKREKQKTILISGGVQLPLAEMNLYKREVKFAPYTKITYLMN